MQLAALFLTVKPHTVVFMNIWQSDPVFVD